ncbi:MAG: 6-pyruvoyl-tetrahydropterin synthase-related protein [bacterium]|nr:6-pyruvoyl-tetrahydropterin synthase-related protein [bacterium]
MKRIGLLILVCSAFIALFHLYFSSSFPYTHDGENHLARFANYKIALREGQFPPRFAPNLLNHYGYPVFNFNYPLANILSLPFSILGVSYELTFKILVVASVMFGSIGVWQLSKVFKATVPTQVLATIFWLLQPYLVSTIYFRGNIGEVFALSLLPWLLKISLTDSRKERMFAIVIFTAFLLSHNISAVLGTGMFLLISFMQSHRSRKLLLRHLAVFGWAVALSFWFWLPAVAEMSYTVVSETSLVSTYFEHFVSLQQLLWSPLGFGFSYPGDVDSLSFSLGLPILVVLFGATIFCIGRQKQGVNSILLLLALAWTTALGQLWMSESLWSAVPAASFIQFPWRLSLFTGALLIPGLIFVVQQSRLMQRLLMVVLTVQVISISRLSPVDFFHKTNLDYDVFSQSTSTQNENRTRQFSYTQIGDWQPAPMLLNPESGNVAVHSWNGSSRKYSLTLSIETIVIEPTMYFPGWETTVEQNGTAAKVEYLQSEEIAGRIAYRLPAGEYQVSTRFTQNTPARLVGNTVSLLALAWLLISARKWRE